MSDGRVRLRLAGEPDVTALPIVSEPEPLPAPTIALVAACDRAPVDALLSAMLEAAQGLRVVRWRAVLRAREGTERVDGEETIVRAGPGTIATAIRELCASAAPADLRIAVGLPFVAVAKPTLAILVTAGTSAVEWDPRARELRDRFDLVIADVRPALARELVRRITALYPALSQ